MNEKKIQHIIIIIFFLSICDGVILLCGMPKLFYVAPCLPSKLIIQPKMIDDWL